MIIKFSLELLVQKIMDEILKEMLNPTSQPVYKLHLYMYILTHPFDGRYKVT